MNLLLLNLFAAAAGPRLRGAVPGAPQWYRPVLVIPFRGQPRYLVAVLESPGPFVFLTSDRPLEGARAPERFGAVAGRRVAAVTASPRDRRLEITFEGDDIVPAAAMTLTFYLYGSQATVELRRGQSTLESVGGRRRGAGEPADRPASLVDASPDEIAAALQADGDAPLRARLPGLDTDLAAVFPGGDGSLDAAALAAFRDDLLAGSTPFRLSGSRRLAAAVPIPANCSAPHGPFRDAIEATGAIGAVILDGARRRIITALTRPLRQRRDANRKLLDNLHRDLARAQGHERIRREAETLAAYQSTIPPGRDAVELPDVYDPDTTVHITLDPSTPLRTQIDKRFRKAGKLEKSETHSRRRIELVERETRELEAAITLLDHPESFARALLHLETLRDRFRLAAPAPSRPAKRAPAPSSPHRRFELGGGWFVLVGKNNRDNDELTFRHAAPEDLWFHAQSVPGSHVVLKSSRPVDAPARVLEAAASIAAHFSRARHSGLVPVIYTRRKYVRKFRGASPGQVRCEREKMIMVAPRLPAGADDSGE